jgi:hypothetical protein
VDESAKGCHDVVDSISLAGSGSFASTRFFINIFFLPFSKFFLFVTALVEIPELAVDLMLSLCRLAFAGLGSLALGDK